ncbi:hypothetical protein V8D89_016043 [Ganoderma adspersum]
MADDGAATPRAPRTTQVASSGPPAQQPEGRCWFHNLEQRARFQLQRRQEYAARLPPIAAEDLPPALLNNPGCRLHYGFECAMPRYEGPDASKMTPKSISWEIVCSVGKKIEQVNKAVSGKRSFPFKQAFTVTDVARPRHDTIVLAMYSSDNPDILEVPRMWPEDTIKRIHDELSKAFGTVKSLRPMWHWDEDRHGADTYAFKPFDEAYPCHPAEVGANPGPGPESS